MFLHQFLCGIQLKHYHAICDALIAHEHTHGAHFLLKQISTWSVLAVSCNLPLTMRS